MARGPWDENDERAVVPGTAAPAPAPPSPLRTGGPGGFEGYVPYHGPVQDFAAMDPARVRELCSLIGGAVDELYAHGRVVHDLVSGLAPLFPADALEASGRDAFLRLCDWLKDAMVDLDERAKKIEVSHAVGALLGAAIPSIEQLLRSAVALTPPAALGIHKRAVRPATEAVKPPEGISPDGIVAAMAAAKALEDLAGDGDDDEVERALEALRHRQEYDPAFAAVVVNALGADGLRDLRQRKRLYGWKRDAYLCSLGRLVADASRSGHLDERLVRDLVDPEYQGLGDLMRCGTWDQDHAYRVGMTLIERDPNVWKGIAGLGSHGLEFFARHPDAAARFVAEHGDRFTGWMVLHRKDLPDLSSEVGRVLLAALESSSEAALARSAATYEAVIRSLGAGERHSKETRLAAAGFIATQMGAVIQQTATEGLEYEGLTLKAHELAACISQLVKEPEAWVLVAGGASTEIRRRGDEWVADIVKRLDEQPDLMAATEYVADRQTGDTYVGELLGAMYQGVVDAADDAKEAAANLAAILQITASAAISLVPVVGVGGGIALKALGELGREVTGKGVERAAEEAARVMTSTSGKRPHPADFRKFVEPHLRHVLAASLFNNEESRARLTDMGMTSPPGCCLQEGMLSVPSPSDTDCYRRFRAWFEPPDEPSTNPLFTVAGKFIHSDGGMMDAFESMVLDTTAGKTD
ncbi:MAG: hypothetical protein ACRDZ7_13555 [Acidimicrobiia bacterium]